MTKLDLQYGTLGVPSIVVPFLIINSIRSVVYSVCAVVGDSITRGFQYQIATVCLTILIFSSQLNGTEANTPQQQQTHTSIRLALSPYRPPVPMTCPAKTKVGSIFLTRDDFTLMDSLVDV